MKIIFPAYNIYNNYDKISQNYTYYPWHKSGNNADTVSFTSKNSDDYITRLNNVEQKLKKKIDGTEICLLKNIYLNEETLPAVEEITDIPNFPKKYLLNFLITNRNNNNYNSDIIKTAHCYNDIYHKLHKNHEHFIGHYTPNHREEINFVFNNTKIVRLAALNDKDIVNILIDKKDEKFRNYTKMLEELHLKAFDILKEALKCKSSDNKPLLPNEKLQLIELLDAYRLVHAGIDEFSKMVSNGVIDISKLRDNLLFEVMKSCGYSKSEIEEIPKNKLSLWDSKYIHLLVRPARKHKSDFSEVIQLANEDTDFKIAIHDTNEDYGIINTRTQKEFKKYGLNYKKWLTPSSKHNVTLKLSNQSSNKLKNASDDYIKNISELLHFTHVNNFIHKKYPKYTNNTEFRLPTEITSNKNELTKFMNNFIKELSPVWNRSQKNSESEDENIRIFAKHILTIKDHLETITKTTETLPNSAEKQNIDLTIKMWDRIPQKDLFQGNYSTCCIGMGSSNAHAVPMYLMNTAFNMIELVDNTTETPVGNALCYYALNSDMKPIFIIDNIEINNNYKPNESACLKIRESIKQYIQKINKDICPNQDIPIYMGDSYNDVPIEDLPELEDEFVTLLGKVSPDEVYLDSFNGWVSPTLINTNKCSFGNIRNNISLRHLS